MVVPYLYEKPSLDGLQNAIYWADAERDTTEIEFEPVDFGHPLWVLFSSGTTGLPKPIVHGHGGVILEHIKCQSLQFNLGSDDTMLWFSTTGWMMWNFDVSGLMLGMTVVLYDGNPVHPDMRNLWELAEETKTTYFGTSAPFIHACMKEGIRPGKELDLHRVRGVGSTAAPLSPEGFQWIIENVGSGRSHRFVLRRNGRVHGVHRAGPVCCRCTPARFRRRAWGARWRRSIPKGNP